MESPMMNTTDQDVWDTKEFLVYCAETHPRAQIQDYIKRLHQSEFGSDYESGSEEESLNSLIKEIQGMTDKMKRRPWIDPFCGYFCRMNLSVSQVLSPELMHRIIQVSQNKVPKTAWFRFEEKMRIFWEVSQEQPGLFRFTAEEVKQYLKRYREEGYPKTRHSEIYKKSYEPAYRVVRKEYGRYPLLYSAVDQCLKKNGRVNVAIDGRCCAGKSQTAALLSTLFDCNIFHIEDFYLPLEKRTPQRMAEVGGSVDRERFRKEVCEPMLTGKPFSYRPFDCSTMQFKDPVEVQPKKVNIIEGAYSMHPELREYYDVTVFLDIAPVEQKARVMERNGRFMLRRFVDEWIPKENEYFREMKVREACQQVY